MRLRRDAVRVGNRYHKDAVEKGGDANVAEKRTLTERQLEFCKLCAAGIKPFEAAKKLGYRNIYRSTGNMLRNERIQQEIARLRGDETMEKPAAEKAEEETPVAEKEEILCFLTEMMREDDDPKLRMKAAELLGKRESLFEKGRQTEERCRVVIVDDIP